MQMAINFFMASFPIKPAASPGRVAAVINRTTALVADPGQNYKTLLMASSSFALATIPVI